MAEPAILSTGKYLPRRVLSNHDLEQMVDTSDEWITTRTGIKERRIAAEDESCSDLAYNAARAALDRVGFDAGDLDLIVVATLTPDYVMPSTACLLQARLGAERAGAADVYAACTGFIYGLAFASGLVANGTIRHALVVGSEVLSRFTDYTDRNTCVLFGDGAGAALLGPSEGRRVLVDFRLRADGTGADKLMIPAGGSLRPPSEETVRERLHYIKMEGREIFKFAVTKLAWLCEEAARAQGVSTREIRVVPHQVNYRIVKAAGERIDISPEQFFLNLERYGNTSGASIPVALDEAIEEGFMKEGDIVVLPGFGGGLTYGYATVRW